LPDGRARLELRLNSIEEIERWVMSMGVHATIVKPKILAERIVKNIIALSDKYQLFNQPMMLNEQSEYLNLQGINIS
jgi:predicted DNA-binding transcriptional regulator YafY